MEIEHVFIFAKEFLETIEDYGRNNINIVVATTSTSK